MRAHQSLKENDCPRGKAIYGKVDKLTFRETNVLEIDPKDIKEHYKLPDDSVYAYVVGVNDNSLVPYGDIQNTLCIAGKGWELRTTSLALFCQPQHHAHISLQ
ncbi:uncharacterized protein G2W53_016262 [Senna tora]|uniref:Uncharacterized protein n=1 Tax=Senna tora TaxID=362788 RepID=A0A834TMM0_9FABA|nr:uncharacterized protein G2W53_016262 [Senna tora]